MVEHLQQKQYNPSLQSGGTTWASPMPLAPTYWETMGLGRIPLLELLWETSLLANTSGFADLLMGLQILGVIQDTEANCFLKKSKTAGQNYTLHCNRWPAWDQAITSACNFSWVIESIENEMTWETAGQEDSDYCLVLREQELKTRELP